MTLLVVRLGALGDIVHTVPAVAAITRALPGARIDWLVERKHRPVLDLFDLDVRPIEIEGGSVGAFLGAMRGLRANGYDVALDFQGLLKSAILARGSGARRVVGFSRDALREPMAGRFYTEDVTPGTARHVIAKNLALVRAVGVESDEIRVPLKRSSEERSKERLAVLNPGAGWPNKQWPPDRFGAVAAGLHTSRNLRCRHLGAGRGTARARGRGLIWRRGGARARHDASAPHDDARVCGAGGVRGHWSDSSRGRGGHADRRPLRANRSRAQRALVRLGRHGVAVLRMRVPPQAAVSSRHPLSRRHHRGRSDRGG